MDAIYHQLNSLSAASSYQEWYQVKAQAFKQDQAFIFCNAQTPLAYNRDQHLFRGGFYSKKYSMHTYHTEVLCSQNNATISP